MTTCSNFPHSPAVIDVLTDLSDGILMDTAAEALCIVSSIVRLADWMITPLTWGMMDFAVNMLPEIFAILGIIAWPDIV